MKKTIFAVEDDEALQELYTYSLENEFNCRCFGDGRSFFESLKTESPDLILLDVMLPGEDGFSILSRLRAMQATHLVPVIMVSAKTEETSKVKGLNMGADDFMAKPFGVMELLARIKANLRRSHAGESHSGSITYKDIVIDSTKYHISVNNKGLQTTVKEFKLLRLLCENAERVQKREVIFREVWSENFVGETRALDINIKQIRRKLAEVESEAVIQTIRGVGYMMA